MKYKHKPTIVNAWQWKEGQENFPPWLKELELRWYGGETPQIDILQKNTVVRISPNDWIIEGLDGNIYPCPDVVFKDSYESSHE